VTTSILAFDVGGTRIKAGLVSLTEQAVVHRSVADVMSGDALLSQISSMGHDLLETQRPTALGLCLPGLIDEGGRSVSLPGKLEGLAGVQVKDALSKDFDVPTVVTNDAIAYATGEAVYGAGQGARRVVVVTIGTGFGVATIEDGRPATSGMLGGGILGGFIPFSDEESESKDSMGWGDTIEASCAAAGIVRCAQEHGAKVDSVPAVYDAVARGEEGAQRGVEQYRHHLARAIRALAHAHAPEAVILGGGPMTPDNPISPGVQELVDARLFEGYSVRIEIAALGDDAALMGIAHLAAEIGS
jgi:glucokinase